MAVVSNCPKCGREGRQNFYKKTGPDGRSYTYLRIMHHFHDECYIGRVRSEGEFMGEINRPETKEDYEKALSEISRKIRKAIVEYTEKSRKAHGAITFRPLAEELTSILEEYGA